MSNNIDDLFDELYPSEGKSDGGPTTANFDDTPPRQLNNQGTPVATNNFDSDDEVDSAGGGAGKTIAQVSGAASASSLNTVPFPNISHPVYEHLHAFYRCTQAYRSYVCSPLQATSKSIGTDEADRLRALFEANNTAAATGMLAKDPKRHQELLAAKGAYHVVAPKRGNGCADFTHQHPEQGSDPTVTAGACGGCPFLVCRKCDHPVIRAEGVRWFGSRLATPTSFDEAAEPETDLYLVIRNYYPDWSRIATAPVTVGQQATLSVKGTPPPPAATSKSDIHGFDDDDDEEVDAKLSAGPCSSPSPLVGINSSPTDAGSVAFALVSDPNSSAYCCQCTWLTVTDTSTGAAISTSVADIAAYAHVPNDPTIITKFISAIANDCAVDYARYAKLKVKRRLPLWACKGHLQ